MTINVKIKEEDIYWTHVFTSGDELGVPGARIKALNFIKAGLLIKTTIEPKDNILTLKVDIIYTVKFCSLCVPFGADKKNLFENQELLKLVGTLLFRALFLFFSLRVPSQNTSSCQRNPTLL